MILKMLPCVLLLLLTSIRLGAIDTEFARILLVLGFFAFELFDLGQPEQKSAMAEVGASNVSTNLYFKIFSILLIFFSVFLCFFEKFCPEIAFFDLFSVVSGFFEKFRPKIAFLTFFRFFQAFLRNFAPKSLFLTFFRIFHMK